MTDVRVTTTRGTDIVLDEATGVAVRSVDHARTILEQRPVVGRPASGPLLITPLALEGMLCCVQQESLNQR